MAGRRMSSSSSSSSPSVSRSVVEEFIRKEVGDWDDETKASARFKAFSGQRSDWEPMYFFWRDLILKVARHLGLFLVPLSEVKNIWFNRGGLSPLCLDQVMLEMLNTGEVLQSKNLVDPSSGQLSRIFRRVTQLVGLVRSSAREVISEDYIIFSKLLKDKAVEIVSVLSENHWTSSCIITMKKFHDICGGPMEASAVFSYLSGCQKAKYLIVNRGEFIEGVKISLSSAPISGDTSLDYNLLHVIWTSERLQQALDVIDKRHEMSRKLALAALKSGSRKAALMHVSNMRVALTSKENYSALLDRVDEVLRLIADADTSKTVSETLQIGVQIIKENRINLEEVQLCLKELDETFDTQKQVVQGLESTPSVSGMEDDDFENELRELELEISENSQISVLKVAPNGEVGEKVPDTAQLLDDALRSLKLTDGTVAESVTKNSMKPGRKSSLEDLKLEAV